MGKEQRKRKGHSIQDLIGIKSFTKYSSAYAGKDTRHKDGLERLSFIIIAYPTQKVKKH